MFFFFLAPFLAIRLVSGWLHDLDSGFFVFIFYVCYVVHNFLGSEIEIGEVGVF